MAPMSVARLGAGVVACGGSLYVVGGFDGDNRWNTVERYQPDTNTWQHVAPMNTVRSGLGKYTAPFNRLMSWNCFLLLEMLTAYDVLHEWCDYIKMTKGNYMKIREQKTTSYLIKWHFTACCYNLQQHKTPLKLKYNSVQL